MIGFHLRIGNPFAKSWVVTRDKFLRSYRITKHKNLELQVSFWSGLDEFFSINLDTWWFGSDHAGPQFDLTILWFFVSIKMYDERHWNHANECWED